ncbi:MAG: hypothetical protein JWO86_1547 [Myxococcaceae bacterium]|nr:hypothetical protein [Myxococcaceae bacterium]
MANRVLSSGSGVIALIVMGLASVATTGCPGAQGKPRVDARSAGTTTTTGNELAGAAVTAPIGEQRLDTSTPASNVAVTPAPITTVRAPQVRSKPGSDENLPTWVPLRGRLTVVEAPDLAENLGLVPKGTTKSTEGRISVAELMDKGASAAATPSEGGPRSATWLASNGRVRRGRGR